MLSFQAFDIYQNTIDQLSACSMLAENARQLTTTQLEIIYREKWFKLFVPHQYGGLQLSLPEGLKLQEDLARIDGSLGWTVTLCSGATMFAGYLQTDVNEQIFKDEKVCFGGSGRANGTATIIDAGYIVTGQWPYATGAPHCTIFTANCYLEQNGERLKNEDGTFVIRSFFFLNNEVQIIETWDMMGLKATAGHTFVVNKIQVAADRSFVIDSNRATLPDPIYKYPFLQFAEATLSVNILGMATHFLELCENIFQNKTYHYSGKNHQFNLTEILLNATEELMHLRQTFYQAITQSWDAHTIEKTEESALLEVNYYSRQLATGARKLVDELFPFCGLTGASANAEINRVWRDIHTASQHSLLNFPTS